MQASLPHGALKLGHTHTHTHTQTLYPDPSFTTSVWDCRFGHAIMPTHASLACEHTHNAHRHRNEYVTSHTKAGVPWNRICLAGLPRRLAGGSSPSLSGIAPRFQWYIACSCNPKIGTGMALLIKGDMPTKADQLGSEHRCTYTHTHAHIYIRTHTRTQTDTRTDTHTHTHTHHTKRTHY